MVPLTAFRRLEALCSRLPSIARNSGPSQGVGSSSITLEVVGGEVEGIAVVDDAGVEIEGPVGFSTGPPGNGSMTTHLLQLPDVSVLL